MKFRLIMVLTQPELTGLEGLRKLAGYPMPEEDWERIPQYTTQQTYLLTPQEAEQLGDMFARRNFGDVTLDLFACEPGEVTAQVEKYDSGEQALLYRLRPDMSARQAVELALRCIIRKRLTTA